MAKRKAKVEPEKPKKKGRPSKYNPAIGRAISKMLATGMTLNAVCKRPKMPHERTVREWAMDPKHPFSPMYARAREVGYARMADEIVQIADDNSHDVRVDEEGNELVNHDHINRARLRIETRKWLLAKALPKVYGERTTTELTGKDGKPIQLEAAGEIEQARRVAFALGRALERQRLKVIEQQAEPEDAS